MVLGADGQPLPGVELYPFEPAGLIPTVVPEGGITAQLVEAESTALALREQAPGGRIESTAIVLADADPDMEWLES